MQASSTFKKTFLNLMIDSLKQDGLQSKSMDIQEKKRAIKLSSYASMALARGPTKWSVALMKKLSRKEKSTINGNECRWKIPACKKIIRRSRRSSRMKNVVASVVARRMVKKRTQMLKRIIPGGESLDGLSLLSETLDYAIHLKAQVNLMQCLAKALGASNLNPQGDVEGKKEKDEQLACHDHSEMGNFTILQPREEVMNSSNGTIKRLKLEKCTPKATLSLSGA